MRRLVVFILVPLLVSSFFVLRMIARIIAFYEEWWAGRLDAWFDDDGV